MARTFTASSGQYLSNANALVTATALTMACWFKANDVTNQRSLISINDGTNDNRWWMLELRGHLAGDFVGARTRAAGGDAAGVTSSGYTTGTWYHAVAVFTSATSRTCYLNGGNSGSDTTNLDPSAAVTTTTIAKRSTVGGGSDHMDGQIAEAAIWNLALGANEIQALANGYPPTKIQSQALKGYWPLGFSSPEVDWSGNGKTMALTGSPTISDHAPVMPQFGYDTGWQGAFTTAAAATTTQLQRRMLRGVGY